MNEMKRSLGILVALLLSCMLAAPAFAQATRTWVSGVGDDANPCSRTAPCKTFAGAISKTAAGGEINAIDPGGFGAVTITKAITINGAGTLAGVLAAGTNGIIVNAAATDTVILRHLDINGGTPASPGLKGVRFLGGKQLIIQDSNIQNFSQAGVEIAPTATTGTVDLVISDTAIGNNAGPGILSTPAGTLAVFGSLDNVRLVGNTSGIDARDGSQFAVRNSVLSNNSSHGVIATGTSRAAAVNVDHSLIASNDTSGVRSVNALAMVRLAGSSIVQNGVGLERVGNGMIASYGNNTFRGNAGGTGASPAPIPLE
jgi:hypothetical protein